MEKGILGGDVEEAAEAGGFGDQGIARADGAVGTGGVQQLDDGVTLLALGVERLGGNSGGDVAGEGCRRQRALGERLLSC